MTLQLAGTRVVMEKQVIECEALPESLNDTAWWKSKSDWLNDAEQVDGVSVHDAARQAGSSSYGNELIKGTIHEWMSENVEEEIIAALANYGIVQVDEPSNTHKAIENKRITYKFIATSLDSGTYKRITEIDYGESVPTGIAQKLYDAVNPLQYEGDFVLIEEDPGGTAYPGTVLNITGGEQAAWASMRAIIQEVHEDADNGTTTIVFGPAQHLGPADLIELLRCNRSRGVSVLWKARETGESYGPESSVELDGFNTSKDSGAGAGEVKEETLYNEDASQEFVIDPDQVDAKNKILTSVEDGDVTRTEMGYLKFTD